jgi:FAD/FMN-containing dehydrogenase
MASGVVPAVLEFMDGDAIACTFAYLNWDATIPAEAALLIEVDGSVGEVAADGPTVERIIRSHQPLVFEETTDAGRRDYLWTLRRSISRAITAAAKLRVSEDVVVPPSRLPELVAALPELSRQSGLRVNSFGHAGDGNLHVNFMASDDSEDTKERIHRAVTELFRLTLTLDGTISGEHGIGTTKRDYLPLEVESSTLELFRRVKGAFDPAGNLNPGKIF